MVKRVLLSVLSEEKRAGEVSVLFVDDDTIAELNASYRKKNKPTDVLAFPAEVPHSAVPVLGDIVISVPTARRQARELGHTLRHEVAFLLIHGMLHLLGYDHHKSWERKKMFSKQDRIFERFRGAGEKVKS